MSTSYASRYFKEKGRCLYTAPMSPVLERLKAAETTQGGRKSARYGPHTGRARVWRRSTLRKAVVIVLRTSLLSIMAGLTKTSAAGGRRIGQVAHAVQFSTVACALSLVSPVALANEVRLFYCCVLSECRVHARGHVLSPNDLPTFPGHSRHERTLSYLHRTSDCTLMRLEAWSSALRRPGRHSADR